MSKHDWNNQTHLRSWDWDKKVSTLSVHLTFSAADNLDDRQTSWITQNFFPISPIASYQTFDMHHNRYQNLERPLYEVFLTLCLSFDYLGKSFCVLRGERNAKVKTNGLRVNGFTLVSSGDHQQWSNAVLTSQLLWGRRFDFVWKIFLRQWNGILPLSIISQSINHCTKSNLL